MFYPCYTISYEFLVHCWNDYGCLGFDWEGFGTLEMQKISVFGPGLSGSRLPGVGSRLQVKKKWFLAVFTSQ